ncbi:MAG: dynamin family protein [Snowella sp.]|nr:dynamin family protein [Snowella sp.]
MPRDERLEEMPRDKRIENIINSRKPFAKELKRTSERMGVVFRSLTELENYRARLESSVEEEEIKQELSQMSLRKQLAELMKQGKQLDILAKRFDRDTLNIGVIGETGAGKSTLLQSLSGLGDQVIPARTGGACTAVRSKIQNLPGQTEVKAEIELHTSETFLEEVIKPYFQKLELGNPPNSLEDFKSQALSQETPARIKGQKEEQMYKHLLNDYYFTLKHYKSLLEDNQNRKEIEITKKEEIEEWVTQKRSANGFLTNFKHLVVRQAKFFCQFKDATMNMNINDKITLVDVPGMGDTRLGDEELMLETIGRDVDAVMFLYLPGTKRFLWKDSFQDLYYNAKNALNNFSERVFIILNLQGDNQEGCDTLQKDRKFEAVDYRIINCSDPQEAYKVFNIILKHLEKRIQDLDRQYCQSVKHSISNLLDSIEKSLIQYQNVLDRFSGEDAKFEHLFLGDDGHSGWWGDITNSLKKYRNDLKNKCNENEIDEDFKEKIEGKLDDCRKNTLPDIEKIKRRSSAKDGFRPTYDSYLSEIRTDISRHLLGLDLDVQKLLDEIKENVAKKLREEGKLMGLSEATGSKFFEEIKQQLPASKQDNLRYIFNYFEQYDVSFAGLVLREIREYLTELYPDQNSKTDINNAEDVEQSLKETRDEVLTLCKQTLEPLSALPNQIAYALVEEFTDHIFCSRGVQSEWRIFLRENRYKVFKELEELGKWEDNKKEWKRLIADTQAQTKLCSQSLF